MNLLTRLLGLPENQAKYRTPLGVALRGVSLRTACCFDAAAPATPAPLATLDTLNPHERALLPGLHEAVHTLATRIGRNVFHPEELARCEAYLLAALARVAPKVGVAQRYRPAPPYDLAEVVNLEGVFTGASKPDEIVVIGAHYDSIELHDHVREASGNCPAANDNATGVGVTLELARLMGEAVSRGERPARTVRFVLFANEEPPFFWTRDMGSVRYADACAQRGERIVAMLTPETLGCFHDEDHTQRLPLGIGRGLVGTRGNWVGFLGLSGARGLMRESVAAFRQGCDVRCVGAELPAIAPMVGASDHWAFWRHGYPALMVTDTAPFRYDAYHQWRDTPERIHWAALARVTWGLWNVVRTLAGVEAERISDADGQGPSVRTGP